MRTPLLVVHIVAGVIGLLAGFLALSVSKGLSRHRQAGRVFVFAMVTMGTTGAILAALKADTPTVIAGSLAAYLVITGLITVQAPTPGARRVDITLMLVALAIAVLSISSAIGVLTGNAGKAQVAPAIGFFVFGTVALIAVILDVRMIRAGRLRGIPRLRRHLWRMTFALFIATFSFFVGQAQIIPKPIRGTGLPVVPVLVVLLSIPYWLWRVRMRRSV